MNSNNNITANVTQRDIVVEAVCLRDKVELLDCWVRPVLESRLCSARLCAAGGDLTEAQRLLEEVHDFLPVWRAYLAAHQRGCHIIDQKDLNGMDVEAVKTLLKEAGVDVVPPGPGGKGCIKFK